MASSPHHNEFQPSAYTSSGAGEIDIKQGNPVGRIYKGDLVISIQNLKGKEFINLGSLELTKK